MFSMKYLKASKVKDMNNIVKMLWANMTIKIFLSGSVCHAICVFSLVKCEGYLFDELRFGYNVIMLSDIHG